MNRTLIQIATRWATKAFGVEHVANSKVRTLRIVEEAMELAQWAGVPLDQIKLAADIVYSRPVGGYDREVGGVMMTTAVLCGWHNHDPEIFFQNELMRVLDKPIETFTERNAQKIKLGLTGG